MEDTVGRIEESHDEFVIRVKIKKLKRMENTRFRFKKIKEFINVLKTPLKFSFKKNEKLIFEEEFKLGLITKDPEDKEPTLSNLFFICFVVLLVSIISCFVGKKFVNKISDTVEKQEFDELSAGKFGIEIADIEEHGDISELDQDPFTQEK